MADARVRFMPNIETGSASFESSSLANACSQNWNVSLSRATSCSLVAVVSTAVRCGAATPAVLLHRMSLPSLARCTWICA
jgi:hypothetical protein